MAKWYEKWKQKEENEQKIRSKLVTLGVVEKKHNRKVETINKSIDIKIAFKKKNNDLVLELIENGESADFKYNGISYLYYCVMNKAYESISIALSYGADLCLENDMIFNEKEFDNNINDIGFYLHKGKTPFDLALENKDIKILDIFLEYSKDEILKNYLNIQLMLSIQNENINDITKYLEYEADLYAKFEYSYKYSSYIDFIGKSSFEILKEKNNTAIFEVILKYYDKDLFFLEFLYKKKYKKEWLKNKIEENYKYNPNQHIEGYTLIYRAIKNENIKQIKLLLENKVNFELKNERYSEDIYELIVSKNNLEIIKLVVKYISNKNKLIVVLINEDKIDFVFKIISEVEDLSSTSILYHAIKKESIKLIKLVLQKNANPNFVTGNKKYKQVPLHLACELQNFNILKLLIENGADTNIQNHEGRTALFNAIEATKANKDIIRYLIQNGADIHKEDNNGISPLSFAESNKKSLVKVLLENMPILLEIEKNFNSNSKLIDNDNKIYEQIIKQNKIIDRLQKKIKDIIPLSKIDELNSTIEIQAKSIKNLENYLQLQSQEIKTIKKEFKDTQIRQTEDINKLVEKIEKLEKENDKKNKKQKVSSNIPIQMENKTINQNDGVLIKREKFDDF